MKDRQNTPLTIILRMLWILFWNTLFTLAIIDITFTTAHTLSKFVLFLTAAFTAWAITQTALTK